MKPQIISQGAEAIIQDNGNGIIKKRIKKSYRIKEIDDKLRTRRTKSEAKIIEKLKDIIPVPRIISVNSENCEIVMEKIDGEKLSENLEKLDYKRISKLIAENITKMHDKGIIHSDLTTSNMILKENHVFFVDFGLGFHSEKIEDKAVDLHLLKQALEAKHYTIAKECFDIILKNYKAKKSKEIIKRIETIEKRGRYRH
jgi:Kae1-associated kinase Bud32